MSKLRKYATALLVIAFTAVLIPSAPGASSATSTTKTIALRSAPVTSASRSTSVNLPTPAGVVAGDLLLASVSVNTGAAVPTPAGWSKVPNWPVSNGPESYRLTQHLFYRFAQSSEPTSVNFTKSGTVTSVIVVTALANVDPTAPFNATASTSITWKALASPTVSTTVSGAFVMAFASARNTAGEPSAAPPITVPTWLSNTTYSGSSATSGAVAMTTQSSAGRIGSGYFGFSTISHAVVGLVALRPASGSTTPTTAPPSTTPTTVAPSPTTTAPPTTTPPTTTPPTTPPSGTGPELGAYTAPVTAGGITGINKFGTDVGAPVTVALAYIDTHGDWGTFSNPSWLLDPWATWLKQNTSRRLVLSVPMLLASNAGEFYNTNLDQYFVKLAQAIKSRGIADQTIIRLGWEMTGNWNPYGRQHNADGSGFRAMWNRVVPKMKAVHPFKFSWCVTLGGPISPAIYYPNNDLVDIVAFDRYDNWVGSATTPSARWNYMLTEKHGINWLRDFANSKGKALAVEEWGLWTPNTSAGGGGDDPYYMTSMHNWATQNGLLYTIYYNSKSGGVGTTLQLNPNSLNAYRTAIR